MVLARTHPQRAAVTRRPCTVAGFYIYAVEEKLLEHSPAAHLRRPRLGYESHATALDRNEVGALLVTAGLARRRARAPLRLLLARYPGPQGCRASGLDLGGRPPFRSLHQSRLH